MINCYGYYDKKENYAMIGHKDEWKKISCTVLT